MLPLRATDCRDAGPGALVGALHQTRGAVAALRETGARLLTLAADHAAER